MLLKNKQTGEMRELPDGFFCGDSLKKICEEWEDVPEEPFSISFYTIVDGKVKHCIFYRERVAGCPDDAWAYLKDDGRESIKQLKAVGLYFETKEEAEKAVEKLKALKRLKDNGMKKYSFRREKGGIDLDFYILTILAPRDEDSLKLLFGGEE